MLESNHTGSRELPGLAFKRHKNSNLRLHDLTDHITDIQMHMSQEHVENYTKHLTSFDNSQQLFLPSA